MAACNRAIGRWGRSQRGSITLESSLVFPWVFMITLLLFLLALTVTQKALLHYSVQAAAERAAFGWPHSASDVRTGAYPQGRYDSLYWRLGDDALIAGLLGGAVGREPLRVPIGEAAPISGNGLAAAKLGKAARTFPAGESGTLAYVNRLWKREVTVEVAGGAFSNALQRYFEIGRTGGPLSAAAVVTEPAEWIRSFDLVRYYNAKMKKSKEGPAAYRTQAAAALERRR